MTATHYLPAARADVEQVDLDSQAFFGSGLYSEVLDLVPEMVLALNQHRQVVYANAAAIATVEAGAAAPRLGLRFGELIGCIHSADEPGGCGTSIACRQCGAARALVASRGGAPA